MTKAKSKITAPNLLRTEKYTTFKKLSIINFINLPLIQRYLPIVVRVGGGQKSPTTKNGGEVVIAATTGSEFAKWRVSHTPNGANLN